MTCDTANGGLECLLDNNNVSNGSVANGDHKHNGVKANGTKPAVPLDNDDIETRKSLIILLTIFVFSLAAMLYIYKTFPELEE